MRLMRSPIFLLLGGLALTACSSQKVKEAEPTAPPPVAAPPSEAPAPAIPEAAPAPGEIPAATVDGTPPTPPTDPAATPDPSTTEATASPTPPEEEKESPFFPGSELKGSISRWIAENPEAEFEDAARAANRFLRELGYPLVLDVSGLIPPEAKSFRMKAGIRTFEFKSGKELASDLDICGERFLRIPGRFVGENEAMLVAKEQEYPFSLQGFRRERFRVIKGKRLVNTLYAPEPTEPIGLSANGSAVYLKFNLDDVLTAEWWQRMGRHQPSLLDEDPYLVIRVSKKSLYFDENLEHLPAQEFEVEQSRKGVFRWRFLPSNLVMELDSQCNAVVKKKG